MHLLRSETSQKLAYCTSGHVWRYQRKNIYTLTVFHVLTHGTNTEVVFMFSQTYPLITCHVLTEWPIYWRNRDSHFYKKSHVVKSYVLSSHKQTRRLQESCFTPRADSLTFHVFRRRTAGAVFHVFTGRLPSYRSYSSRFRKHTRLLH